MAGDKHFITALSTEVCADDDYAAAMHVLAEDYADVM